MVSYNLTVDTHTSYGTDRIKIYVNGVQETSFSTETYPAKNAMSLLE